VVWAPPRGSAARRRRHASCEPKNLIKNDGAQELDFLHQASADGPMSTFCLGVIRFPAAEHKMRIDPLFLPWLMVIVVQSVGFRAQ
jgi:hypothetical protein